MKAGIESQAIYLVSRTEPRVAVSAINKLNVNTKAVSNPQEKTLPQILITTWQRNLQAEIKSAKGLTRENQQKRTRGSKVPERLDQNR